MSKRLNKRFKKQHAFVYLINELQLTDDEVLEFLTDSSVIDDYEGDLEEAEQLLRQDIGEVRRLKKLPPSNWLPELLEGIRHYLDYQERKVSRFNNEGHPVFNAKLPAPNARLAHFGLLVQLLHLKNNEIAYVLEEKSELTH